MILPMAGDHHAAAALPHCATLHRLPVPVLSISRSCNTHAITAVSEPLVCTGVQLEFVDRQQIQRVQLGQQIQPLDSNPFF